MVNRKCLIYLHGGGAVAAYAEDFNHYCHRMAVDFDVTVVNVNYRLAPEHKIPCGIDDSYAAVKWVIANASELGINPKRIATIGESGGGYLVGAVSLRLAEANEGQLLKFAAHLMPMVSNWLFVTPEAELSEESKGWKHMSAGIYSALGDFEDM